MKIYPPFPTCREATPTRRAEKLIYETLEASELDGLAPVRGQTLELCSPAGLRGLAPGHWDLRHSGQGRPGTSSSTASGTRSPTGAGSRKESPIPGTWDAAMAIHDVVQEHLRHKTFVIPVLVLTDMEPEPREIEALAAARNVAVHWGIPRQPGGAPGGAGRGAEGLRQANVCRHRRGGGAGAPRVNPGSPDY